MAISKKDGIGAHQYFFIDPFVWCKLLWTNRKGPKSSIRRLVLITSISVLSYPFQLMNGWLAYWKSRNLPDVPDPVFIIGHWRSGTTFLQYLLSQDDRFGYLTYYQAFIPNLSILGGKWLKRRVAPFIPAKRPQDDVHLHVDLPTEEENPIATFGTTSASHSWFWPTNESYHRRYAIFNGITQADYLRWTKNYRRMLRRISINWPGRQLLIKNPHNTGRIPELLELYPNARFIYLHRDPQEVYPSTRLMYDRVILTQYLELYPVSNTTDKIFNYAVDILDRYMSTSRQVRPSHLIEIDYTHLVKDPKEVIAQIYGHFDYHLDNATLDRITTYLSERSDYRVNRHVNDAALFRRIQTSWPAFERNKNDV